MKNAIHGLLEHGASIFKEKRHDLVGKGTPRGCECAIVLIYMENLNLVVAWEAIHNR